MRKAKTFGFKFRGKCYYKVLKLYGKSWPKFEQVTKNVPTPRTFELSAFDEKSTFDCFAFFFKDMV
jgi:hypothetical protein